MHHVARQGLWRGAPVAVKYSRCDTSDSAALERCIREAVLSRRMSHPHVVQTFAWTVLTADDATAVRAVHNRDQSTFLVSWSCTRTCDMRSEVTVV